jgi:hypothetical protein
MTMQEIGKAVGATVESMKAAPLAVALLIVNAGFIALFGYVLHEIAQKAADRDVREAELLKALITECRPPPKDLNP